MIPSHDGDGWQAAGTVRGMTQPESRWSLAHTGNRVLLAVVVGVVVGALGSAAGIHAGGHIALFAVAGVLTYALATVLRRRH